MSDRMTLVNGTDRDSVVTRINKLLEDGWELRGHVMPVPSLNVHGISATNYVATLVHHDPVKTETAGSSEGEDVPGGL